MFTLYKASDRTFLLQWGRRHAKSNTEHLIYYTVALACRQDGALLLSGSFLWWDGRPLSFVKKLKQLLKIQYDYRRSQLKVVSGRDAQPTIRLHGSRSTHMDENVV